MAEDKNQSEEDENVNSGSESDDTFGLPDIDYQPLNREEEQTPEEPQQEPVQEETQEYVAPQVAEEEPTTSTYQPSTYSREKSEYRYQQESESSSIWPKIIGIVVFLIIAGGAAWFFLMYQPAQKEKARLEQERKATRDKQIADSLANVKRIADLARAAEQRRLDSLAAIPKEGAIETLSARTGRYYVVVSSAVDDDLIMDYAKKLSDKGVSSKIIPPFGKHKFFRIAVADGESFNEAQQKADEMKPDYSDALWVLKY